MQCLFCGKELPLLQRLRGGGEFCSEAHRKEYQEQYEQLALARLMQAKPLAERAAPLNAPDPRLESTRREAPAASPDRQVHSPSPVPVAEAPVSAESGPAPLAGFLNKPVVPAVTAFEQASAVEPDNTWDRVTTLPGLSPLNAANGVDSANHGSDASSSPECPPTAPRVELGLSLRALEHHTRSERGLELREFTGPAPVMELQLRPESGSNPAEARDAMEILMSPRPPQKAKPWLGVPRGFPAAPAELGDLARLDFAIMGFAHADGSAAAPAPALAPELPQAPSEVRPEEPPQARAVEPVAPVEAPVVAEQMPAEPAPPELHVPELVTKVLPVTLHGLAAARGKLTQTFPSAIAAASDVQIPAPATLPLRPTIVFGPRPAPPRAPETAAAPAPPTKVQSKPVQAAPTQAQPPVRPITVEPENRVRPAVVPAAKPAPVERQAAPVANPRVDELANPRVAERANPRSESPAPKPQPAPAASETEIPSLRLESTAWSKLSGGLKIGVAAALVAAVSGVAYLVTRGNGKSPAEAPAAVTATPAVAAGVAISGGWIDDWANSAKSKRHISLLSGSAKLSDYRLEFQAQIQTKAIGWIFRGLNPRNYYVTKLEIVTPGLEPTIALVHFAVVDGLDENRVTVPLPLKVRVDTTYKIRFEAIGSHFTTWVQGQKIDEWTDSRFGSGGVGFFSERDEQAAMQGDVNVVPLVPKN